MENEQLDASEKRQAAALEFLGEINLGKANVGVRPADLLRLNETLNDEPDKPASVHSGTSNDMNARERAAASFLGTISLGRPGRIPGGKQAGANFVSNSPRPSLEPTRTPEPIPDMPLPVSHQVHQGSLPKLRLKTSSLGDSDSFPLLPSSSAAKKFGSFRNLVNNITPGTKTPAPSPLGHSRQKSQTLPSISTTPMTPKRERRISQQLTDFPIKTKRSMESPGAWQVVITPNGIVRTWTSDVATVHPLLEQVKQQQVELMREMEEKSTKRTKRTESFGGTSQTASSLDENEYPPYSPQDVQPPLLLVPGNQMTHAKVGHAIVSELNGGQSVLMVTNCGSPMSVWSVHRYMGAEERGLSKRVQTLEKMGYSDEIYTKPLYIGDVAAVAGPGGTKKKAESFAHCLDALGVLENDEPDTDLYDPDFIDDPSLKTGKHRTVMTLPSWVGSVIHYVRPAELIQELNEQFRATHPDVDPSLTLTMIRGLKRVMLACATDAGMEWSSAAIAYVYLDKLILAARVQKLNRKLCGAICLLLASKVNDPKETNFARVLECLSKHFQVPQDVIKKFEFQAYAALDFALYLAPWEVAPHLERILSLKNTKLDDYVRQGAPPGNPDYNLDFYNGAD
jgi:hypothetical protein